jgi:hypothetical protein
MDPLSGVFSLLNVENTVSARLEAGGAWAMRIDGYRHVNSGAVLRGSYWISVTAAGRPSRLTAALSSPRRPTAPSVTETATTRWSSAHSSSSTRSTPRCCRTSCRRCFVQALRAYAASEQRPASGGLGALADPQIGAALELMHRHPARRRTVQARRLTR